MRTRLAAGAAALCAGSLLASCASTDAAAPVPDGTGIPALNAAVTLSVVACEQAALCVAAGTNPTSATGVASIEVSPGGTHRWRSAGVQPLVGVSLVAASCWGAGCLLGGSGPSGAVVLRVNPATMASSSLSTRPPGSGIAALSCTGPGRCVALVTGTVSTIVFATTDSGQSWRQLSTLPGALQSGTSLSCPSTARCVAVGTGPSGGAVARSNDGGRKWLLSRRPGGLQVLTAVGCAGVSCLAAARKTSGASVLLRSVNGGESWTSIATKVTNPVSVTCLSSRTCLVGGGGGAGGQISVFTATVTGPVHPPVTGPSASSTTVAPVPTLTEKPLLLAYVPDPVIGLSCATPARCAGVTQASTISFVP